MSIENELATAAAKLRELTGETQVEFGRRLGFGMESIQRFENPRFKLSQTALVQYAETAFAIGHQDLSRIFSDALLESLGPKAVTVLRRALTEVPVPFAMDVPTKHQPLVRQLLTILDHPKTAVEKKLGEFIAGALDPSSTTLE